MRTRTKILVLVAGICSLMSLLAPVAHAIEISVAEVRDNTAFVRGSDAGRKQEYFGKMIMSPLPTGREISVSKEFYLILVTRTVAKEC